MNRRIAFPFLTLPDDVVGFGGWFIGDPGQPLNKAPDALEAWDYERDIEAAATFDIDLARAAVALGIGTSDLVLEIALKVGTGEGSVPRRIEIAERVRIDRSGKLRLGASIPSWRLSGRLRLEAVISLGASPTTATSLSPTVPGSRLWADRMDILLEDGGSSRFPIEVVSFSRAFAGLECESAPWYVLWRPGDLAADFGGSVRVYVNQDITDLTDRFVAGDALTLTAILGDVMSQMVSAAVSSDDSEHLLADCGEGSVGAQIVNWIEMAFPDQSLPSIRSMMQSTPGRFRAALLSAARLPEEP